MDAVLATSGISNIIRLWSPESIHKELRADRSPTASSRAAGSGDEETLGTDLSFEQSSERQSDRHEAIMAENQRRMSDGPQLGLRPISPTVLHLLLQRAREGGVQEGCTPS